MSKIIDNPMIMREWSYERDNQWDDDNPAWEPEHNGRLYGKYLDDPTIDHYEERLIEERRGR